MSEIKKLFPIKDCEFEENNNLVTVLLKNKKPSFIEKLFFKKHLEKPYKIDLDEIGSFIWHKCSGENSVEEITVLAKQEFHDKMEKAEARVELFISQMTKNKLIKLYEKVEK